MIPRKLLSAEIATAAAQAAHQEVSTVLPRCWPDITQASHITSNVQAIHKSHYYKS